MPRPQRFLYAVLSILVAAGAAEAQTAPAPGDVDTPIKATGRSELGAYTDSDHVSVVTPSVATSVADPTAGWSASGSYLVDVISAASVDIVSTASSTWREVRQAGTVSGEYKPHTFGGTVSGAVSSEPDYLSISGGGALSLDLDERNYSLLLGYSYGHDTAGRTGTPFNVFSLTLDRHSINGGLNVVMDRSTLLILVGDIEIEAGDQSKPYRYIPMFAPDVAGQIPVGASVERVNANRLPERPREQLPLTRQRYSLTGRFAHRFRTTTIRASERLYADSWGLKATTTDGRWLLDVGRFEIGAHLRGHLQTPVGFWKRAYTLVYAGNDGWVVPRYRTGDRELGPLASLALGATGTWYLGGKPAEDAWQLGVMVEGTQTIYLDDLYVMRRVAGLSAITFGGTF